MKKICKREIKYQEKGITLVALVVTIVVLLILAGVTINLALDNNGLIGRAKLASNIYKQLEENDIKMLKKYEEIIDDKVKKRKAKFMDELINKTHSYGNYRTITKIERSSSEPNEQYKQEINIVSAEDSDYIIYMWSDNNVLYWYCEEAHPLLCSDSSRLFASFEQLEDAEGLKDIDTSNVTNMSQMFADCGKLKRISVSEWNTSNVTNMYAMFAGCITIETIDLSGWDTKNVTNMYAMFANGNHVDSWGNYISNLKTIIVSDKFVVDNVTDSLGMFGNCVSLIGENGTSYNSASIDKTMAYIDAIGRPGYFTAKK